MCWEVEIGTGCSSKYSDHSLNLIEETFEVSKDKVSY